MSSSGKEKAIVWQKTYGGRGHDMLSVIQQTIDGGYIVGGYTNSFDMEGFDFHILKLDSYGNKIWDRTFGGKKDDMASVIQQTKDGGYIVGGYTFFFDAGESDFYILKLDENGNTAK